MNKTRIESKTNESGCTYYQKCNSIVYDMNNQGSFQCLAIARTEEQKKELESRGYLAFFTPEIHGTNCWILVRDKSEVDFPPIQEYRKKIIEMVERITDQRILKMVMSFVETGYKEERAGR